MTDSELIANLSRVAEAYLREDADYDESANLLRAFGSNSIHDLHHCRSVWLCCLAASRMLPKMVVMPGTARTLGMIVTEIQTWMTDDKPPDDIATICNPDPALMPLRNREWREAESIDMISSLARFALHGGLPDGVEVLDHALTWDQLRSYNLPNAMPFERWIRDIAIPASLTRSHLKDQQMMPITAKASAVSRLFLGAAARAIRE